jgi:SAM-dependent methyltransferase
MADGAEVRSYGAVFDQQAERYDRHRPTYPDALIDRACEAAGLAPGDRVLEIGCGTGQLTRGLLARGLQVTAVEPGQQLIARAREGLAATDHVRFINARLEDARLPHEHYRAAFAASAIHWIDPDVGWGKLAGALVEGGWLGLISYFGTEDPRTAEDQRALRAALGSIAPEPSAEWPTYRELHAMLAGVEERRRNISEAWAWLGSYDVGRPYASELFEDACLTAMPGVVEQSANELNALLGTMSFWARLSGGQRDALAAANRALEKRLGRPIRSSTAACLVIARRTSAGGRRTQPARRSE